MFRKTLPILSILNIIGFIFLTYLIEKRDFFYRDFLIIDFTKSFTSPFTVAVLQAVSWPGYLPQAFFFITGFILILIVLKKRLAAAISLISLSAIFSLVYFFKLTISRLRPDSHLYLYSGQNMSYPSGHMVSYTVFLGLLLYFSSQYFKNPWLKLAHAVLYFTLLVLVGFSRIYLGHHWPTDVVGGLLLGFSWLTLTILAHNIIIHHFDQAKRVEKSLG